MLQTVQDMKYVYAKIPCNLLILEKIFVNQSVYYVN
jgi:hypothetical protein